MITVKQLDKYTGRSGWKMPSKEEYEFSRVLVGGLKEGYEKVEEIIELYKVDYQVGRLHENRDIIVVYPKERGQFVVLYNEKLNNTNIISNPHSGQDSVDNIGYDLMIEEVYKCMIINGYQPNSSDEASEYQKGRKISNADHSTAPSMVHFLDEYINKSGLEPYLYVLHGMSSRKHFSVWHISSTGQRTSKEFNICFFMCVAWCFSKFKDLLGQTNYNFDDFYLLRKDGTKKFLTGDKDSNNCFFRTFRGPTTSVSSSVMNGGKIPVKHKVLKDSGKVCHCENAISTLGNRSRHVVSYQKEAFRLMKLAENKNMKDAPRDLNELILWLENPTMVDCF